MFSTTRWREFDLMINTRRPPPPIDSRKCQGARRAGRGEDPQIWALDHIEDANHAPQASKR